jgi:hypothetical protein
MHQCPVQERRGRGMVPFRWGSNRLRDATRPRLKDLLRNNIREVGTMCRISCNAGTAETKLVGDPPGH